MAAAGSRLVRLTTCIAKLSCQDGLVTLDLGRALHTLTARLDRAAHRILRVEEQLSYRRFLVLFMIGELGVPNQRALAEALGVTEPSVSRMIGALTSAGLLDAAPDPAGGNRNRLSLTADGRELVRRCANLLAGRLVTLVEASGVPYDVYTRHTNQLLATLDAGERRAARQRTSAY
jgi:DNA-binding MarR family transcriptional regulator